MTTVTFEVDPEAPVLVDFGTRGSMTLSDVGGTLGVEQLENLTAKSQRAINSAMTTIHSMSQRVTATIKAMPAVERPSVIELEFGLKLDADAGALITRVGAEASFAVKLVWEREEKPLANIPQLKA